MPDRGYFPGEFIAAEHSAFGNSVPIITLPTESGCFEANRGYRKSELLESEDSVMSSGHYDGSLEASKDSAGFEVLMVEWMFGTTEFSAWSD